LTSAQDCDGLIKL